MPFNYRILLVDDEPSIRTLGKALLETQGYEVVCAEDGFEGLFALKQSLPDVIISDLRMPNMSGFEFLSVVRRRFPQLPVIAISGEYTTPMPESVLADAFFTKGQYTPKELFAKIIDLLQHIPTRPRVAKHNTPAIWVRNTNGSVVVTCTSCFRTFPVSHVTKGVHISDCDFCSTSVCFEVTEVTEDTALKS